MIGKWQIEYLEVAPKNIPIYDFIESLEATIKAKINNTLELLSKFGTRLGPPHSKKLAGTPFYELRILGQNNIRIFYIAQPDKKFLLIHGFVKKSEKTPQKEIETALKRFDKIVG